MAKVAQLVERLSRTPRAGKGFWLFLTVNAKNGFKIKPN
jgi:hypothetical protein